jgi:hypothetical protein
MDDHNFEIMFAGVIQKLPEYWPAGNGFNVSRFAFLTVDSGWFPSPILTEFPE